jgi:hypothetical protein
MSTLSTCFNPQYETCKAVQEEVAGDPSLAWAVLGFSSPQEGIKNLLGELQRMKGRQFVSFRIQHVVKKKVNLLLIE